MRIEIRTCIKCGEEKEIKQRHIHANNICGDCQRERAKEYAKEVAIKLGKSNIVGRKPYPNGFDTAGRSKFYRLKTELDKCKNREEWIPIIARNLDITLNDAEIMKWIKSEKEEEKPKKQKVINRELPDTRGITWEEWDKLGYGSEEDK
jgi:DNA-directed RNA polymerase subunit M/transcription elongation factor TFIIS